MWVRLFKIVSFSHWALERPSSPFHCCSNWIQIWELRRSKMLSGFTGLPGFTEHPVRSFRGLCKGQKWSRTDLLGPRLPLLTLFPKVDYKLLQLGVHAILWIFHELHPETLLRKVASQGKSHPNLISGQNPHLLFLEDRDDMLYVIPWQCDSEGTHYSFLNKLLTKAGSYTLVTAAPLTLQGVPTVTY